MFNEMNNELHSLCDSLISVLREEIKIYRKLRESLLNERDVVVGSSVEELHESNSRKETCILKAKMAKDVRSKLFERIIDTFNSDGQSLDLDEKALSTLLPHADNDQKKDLEDCRSELKSLLMDIRELNEKNKTLLYSSLLYVRKSIDFLGQLISPGATYMSTGSLKTNNLNGRIISREG